jgi:hypothetical protein
LPSDIIQIILYQTTHLTFTVWTKYFTTFINGKNTPLRLPHLSGNEKRKHQSLDYNIPNQIYFKNLELKVKAS